MLTDLFWITLSEKFLSFLKASSYGFMAPLLGGLFEEELSLMASFFFFWTVMSKHRNLQTHLPPCYNILNEFLERHRQLTCFLSPSRSWVHLWKPILWPVLRRGNARCSPIHPRSRAGVRSTSSPDPCPLDPLQWSDIPWFGDLKEVKCKQTVVVGDPL